jgi:hypothetical protein
MPVASTSKRNSRKTASVTQGSLRSKKGHMLRVINQPETLAWNEALKNASLLESGFETLDEACEYPFKVGRASLWATYYSAYCSKNIINVILFCRTKIRYGFEQRETNGRLVKCLVESFVRAPLDM